MDATVGRGVGQRTDYGPCDLAIPRGALPPDLGQWRHDVRGPTESATLEAIKSFGPSSIACTTFMSCALSMSRRKSGS